jgi:hypothetical protein
MRNWMKIGVIGVVLGAAAGGACGATESGVNAATAYYKAWLITEPDLESLLVTGGETLDLREGAMEKLQAAQGSIHLILRAAEIGEVDWDVSYEDGPGAVLPHLGKMRSSAKILVADALRCLEQGDLEGAAQRTAAVYQMAEHVTQGEVLICSLVGMAIGNLGNELTLQLIEANAFDESRANVVLQAIQYRDGDDRYALREAIIGEWRIMSEHIVRRSVSMNGKELVESVSLDASTGPAKEVATMSRDELLRSLGGFAAYHGDLLLAWDSGDAEAVQDLDARMERREYGALTQLLGASVSRAYMSDQRSKREVADVIGRLKAIED